MRKPGGPSAQPDLQHTSIGQYLLLICLMAAVAGVVVAVHWPALSAKALSYDDQQYMTENILVRNPSWSSAWQFLSEVLAPSTVEGYYQPLTMISLMVDYALGGRPSDLGPFHLTSLLLHAANTSLIILLMYLIFGRVAPAVLVGLLFGIHPLTVEPIPWIGERKTLLAAFFGLWCLIFYVRYARSSGWFNYVVCILAYVLALMSKPTSTPLPVVMLLLDYWPLGRFNKRAIFEKLPFFVLGGVSAVITYISQSTTAGAHPPSEYGLLHVPYILCHNIVFYLYKIVFPTNLSSHYPFPDPLTITHPMVLAGVVGTSVLAGLLLISLRRTRAFLIGWLIFFVTIFPTMQVIGFSNVIASDKFAYLPSVGILLVLVWLVSQWWGQRSGLVLRRGGVVAVVAMLAVLEVRVVRNYYPYWRDSVTLFQRMVSMTPKAAPLHDALGSAYMDQRMIDEAIASYRRAVKLEPDRAGIYNNLAIALYEKGRVDEAVEYYKLGLKMEPMNANSYYNLANVLFERGQVDESLRYYATAARLRPGYPIIHFKYGHALVKKGLFDEGIEHYGKAEALMSENADLYFFWAKALERKGEFDGAVEQYHKALALKDDYAEVYNNLAMLQVRSKNYAEAVGLLEKAVKYRPDYAKAHNNLGGALYKLGRVDEAIAHYRSALAIDPDNLASHINLARTLLVRGELDGAIKHYNAALKVDPASPQALAGLKIALSRKRDSGQ
ncbi:MAG: tetratricopeptide repeat protein [Planctomycetota bacterium]